MESDQPALPSQQPDRPQSHPVFGDGPFQEPITYLALAPIEAEPAHDPKKQANCFPGLYQATGQVNYVLLSRTPWFNPGQAWLSRTRIAVTSGGINRI